MYKLAIFLLVCLSKDVNAQSTAASVNPFQAFFSAWSSFIQTWVQFIQNFFSSFQNIVPTVERIFFPLAAIPSASTGSTSKRSVPNFSSTSALPFNFLLNPNNDVAKRSTNGFFSSLIPSTPFSLRGGSTFSATPGSTPFPFPGFPSSTTQQPNQLPFPFGGLPSSNSAEQSAGSFFPNPLEALQNTVTASPTTGTTASFLTNPTGTNINTPSSIPTTSSNNIRRSVDNLFANPLGPLENVFSLPLAANPVRRSADNNFLQNVLESSSNTQSATSSAPTAAPTRRSIDNALQNAVGSLTQSIASNSQSLTNAISQTPSRRSIDNFLNPLAALPESTAQATNVIRRSADNLVNDALGETRRLSSSLGNAVSRVETDLESFASPLTSEIRRSADNILQDFARPSFSLPLFSNFENPGTSKRSTANSGEGSSGGGNFFENLF